MINHSSPPARSTILRKLISWTLIAALICQPVTASARLAGSLPPTPSNDINLIGSTLDSGNNLAAQGKN